MLRRRPVGGSRSIPWTVGVRLPVGIRVRSASRPVLRGAGWFRRSGVRAWLLSGARGHLRSDLRGDRRLPRALFQCALQPASDFRGCSSCSPERFLRGAGHCSASVFCRFEQYPFPAFGVHDAFSRKLACVLVTRSASRSSIGFSDGRFRVRPGLAVTLTFAAQLIPGFCTTEEGELTTHWFYTQREEGQVFGDDPQDEIHSTISRRIARRELSYRSEHPERNIVRLQDPTTV